MKNNIKKAFASSLIFLFFCLGACNDKEFIDLKSPTALSPLDYYKTETQIKDAVTGTYAVLREVYSLNYTILAEMPSDNTITVSTNESFDGPFDKLSWTSTQSQIGSFWNSSYKLISRSNTVLSAIDGITFENDEVKKRYIGEVKFLRALMYFNLVRFFGDVPLVTKKIETEEEAYTYSRESAAKIYTQIIQDLTDAENILPTKYTKLDIGRTTKGAAQALLGKVYLQQKNWKSAISSLKKVIDSNVYTLLPNYADVFKVENNNNSEIIFAIQFTGGTNGEGSSFFIDFVPQGSGTTIVTGGIPGSQHLGTEDLFNAFEQGDLRKTITIRPFVVTPTYTQYYTYKFFEVALRGEGSQDWPVIRYSDVLLMYAEALNKDNNTSEALLSSSSTGSSINRVRTRAGLAELLATLTQSQLNLAIEKERRVELAFEGDRWLDLTRNKRFIPVMKDYKTKYNETTMQIDDNSGFKSLYPIPFRERQLNPNLSQNPGY
jgi:tetratricopeptide (TPR) repeat protein